MNNEKMQELEEKVMNLALEKLDIDAIAETLAKKLATSIKKDFSNIESEIDFSGWISEELNDPTTIAGKKLEKAMSAIASKMAESIS